MPAPMGLNVSLPIRFGHPERRLFGIYHAGAAAAKGVDAVTDPPAVLLCNPFGQEAVRSHRVLRVLAERLARSGVDVLRFDAYGSGDSDGEDGDFDLDGSVTDLLRAHGELQRRSMSSRMIWVGVRLGGSAAIRAMARCSGALPRLVLWDPIVDGPAYLRTLRAKHVEALETSYSVMDRGLRRRLIEDPTAFVGEAMGFAVSQRLRTQLQAMAPTTLAVRPEVQAQVLALPDDKDVQGWVARQHSQGIHVEFVALAQTVEWMAEEALNSALVPADILRQLTQGIA